MRPVFSCIAVTFAALTEGLMYTWNGIALPQIEEELLGNNTDCADGLVGKISLLSSADNIGSAVGAVFAGLAVSFLPNHSLIPGLAVVTGLCLVCLMTAPFPGMVAGKFLFGLAVTIQCSAVPLYISSVAPPTQRTLLLSLYSIVRNGGQVVVTSMSVLTPLPWRTITAISGLAPAVLLLLTAPFLSRPKPENKIGQERSEEEKNYGMQKATISNTGSKPKQLQDKSRNHCSSPVKTVIEPDGKHESILEAKREQENNYESCKTSTLRKEGLTIIKTTMFIAFFACSANLSGVVLIDNYPSKLITNIYPYQAITVLSISLGVNLFGSFVSSFVTTNFGMKPLLLASTALTAICMFVFTVFYSFNPCSSGSAWCYVPAANIVGLFALLISNLLYSIFFSFLFRLLHRHGQPPTYHHRRMASAEEKGIHHAHHTRLTEGLRCGSKRHGPNSCGSTSQLGSGGSIYFIWSVQRFCLYCGIFLAFMNQ